MCFFCIVMGQDSELDELRALLSASTGATIINRDDPLAKGTASLNSASISSLNDPLNEPVADEQTRIHTLIRAFRRLPQNELIKYEELSKQLDLHGEGEDINPTSELASLLQEAWDDRQKELKKAIESIVSPGKHMRDLLQSIEVGIEKNDDTIVKILHQLADLVDDVDNARDFYKMGGFDIIAKIVSKDQGSMSDEERSIAALIVGNVVKHDYDQQLWTLNEYSGVTLLESLMHMLNGESGQVQKRALYAIASASRGNADVQIELHKLPISDTLIRISSENSDIHRKVLAFVSDMLIEYQFIKEQLDDGELHDSDTATIAASELMTQLNSLKPVGTLFCTYEWSSNVFDAIQTSSVKLTEHKTTPLVDRELASNAITALKVMCETCRDIVQVSKNDINVLTHLRAIKTWAIDAGDTGEDLDMNIDELHHSCLNVHIDTN